MVDAQVAQEAADQPLLYWPRHKDEYLPPRLGRAKQGRSQDPAEVPKLGGHRANVVAEGPPVDKVGHPRVVACETKVHRGPLVPVLGIPMLDIVSQRLPLARQQSVEPQVKRAEANVAMDAHVAQPLSVCLGFGPRNSQSLKLGLETTVSKLTDCGHRRHRWCVCSNRRASHSTSVGTETPQTDSCQAQLS